MSFYFYQISVKTNAANLFIPIVRKPKNTWFVTKGIWADSLVTQITNIKWARKNTKRGDWGYTFFKTPLEFFIFYFRPGNSWQNKVQPLYIPQNCVRTLGNSKAKDKDPWKFSIIFSWSPLEIPLRF